MEREIVVRGTGEARALPDQASLRVEVIADRKTQDEAYEVRAKMAARVDNMLARHANAIARTTIASLVVQPRTRWHRGEDIRTGWRASRTSFIDVVVLDALGDLMASLVEAGASVQGPAWSMAGSNPAYDQARRSAAEDARRRGESYASALGLTLGPVSWVTEPGLRSGDQPPPVPITPLDAEVQPRLARAAPYGTEGENENLSPSEMTVVAHVEVGFMIIDVGRRSSIDLDLELG
jgi:uncharacterized protein YggE